MSLRLHYVKQRRNFNKIGQTKTISPSVVARVPPRPHIRTHTHTHFEGTPDQGAVTVYL